MHTNPPGFNDPEGTGDWLCTQQKCQLGDARFNRRRRLTSRASQDRHSFSCFGRKAQDFREVEIKGDKHPALVTAHFVNSNIWDSAEPLLKYSHNIVTIRLKHIFAERSQVLVKFQLHFAVITGTGMIRSRATSAP